MLYEKFTRLIEEHAEYLTRRWLDEVKMNSATKSYQKLPENVLRERVFTVYKNLGEYMLSDDSNYEKCARHYFNLGQERAKEEIPLNEVIYALILSRVLLWNYISENGFIDGALELHNALNFYQKINAFFDKALYFSSLGYESISSNDRKIDESEFIGKTAKALSHWIIKIPQ
ncbi:MAG: hypothetical protein GXO87_12340 [Chlorobi bacterium]|nr:hypothetical protein [Chlorobiota bacterium]